MQCTTEELHPRPVQLKIVESWECGPKGLLLYGPSRTGKTRAACYLLDSLIDQGKTVKMVRAVDFQNEIIRRAMGDGDLAEFMDELFAVDVLLIDDLDKARFTPRVVSEFFNLLDKRTGDELPMIITVNSTGDALAKKMSDDTGPAIIGRLVEFFQPVNFAPMPKAPATQPTAPQITHNEPDGSAAQ